MGDIAVLNGQGTRFDELAFTKQAAEKWGPIIRTSKFHGILLTITNPCDVITRYLQELTGLPKAKIFGTGTSLDTARFKHAVGEILTIAPDSVDGLILGEHGETQFIAWHATSIGYRPILEQISPEQQEKIEALTFALGEKTFTGKGYTSYGIANQAAQIIDAILTDSHRIFPFIAFSHCLSTIKRPISTSVMRQKSAHKASKKAIRPSYLVMKSKNGPSLSTGFKPCTMQSTKKNEESCCSYKKIQKIQKLSYKLLDFLDFYL